MKATRGIITGLVLAACAVLWFCGCWQKRYAAAPPSPPSPPAGTSTPGVGKIKLPRPFDGVLLLAHGERDETPDSYPIQKGTAEVPAGQYDLVYFQLEQAKDGSQWQASCNNYADPTSVKVDEGRTVLLQVGPPFTAEVDVSGSDNSVQMELTIIDSAKRSYTIMKSDSESAPEFVVLDTRGKEVWGGAFEYG